MARARWRKVLADLWGNRTRTFLVALSIAVGVFAVGFVTSTYVILKADIPADFLSANPHAAIVYTEPIDAGTVEALRDIPGVAAVEGRGAMAIKLHNADGSYTPIQLNATLPLDQMRIDTLRLEQGAATPGAHGLLLERQVASKLGYAVGDVVQVVPADGQTYEMRVAGIVQDVTGSAFLFSGQANAFTGADTLLWLGGPGGATQILLTLSEPTDDLDRVREVSTLVASQLETQGIQVYTTVVSQPGQHPNQTLLNALLALMGGLGILSLFLGGFLVVNTIAALMGQQVRQIGVMKAVGATVRQITGLYVVLVLTYGLAALVAAIPTAAAAAYGMCVVLAAGMNVNLTGFHIPVIAIVLQAVIALFVPVVGAIVPILRGARITVREAITSYGLSATARLTLLDRLLTVFRRLPRPLMLSLRNTFRRTGRLVLTLTTLTLGGAIFISVFGVRDAINAALDKTFGYTLADVNVGFTQPYPIETLKDALMDVPGISQIEGWTFESVKALGSGAHTGDDIDVQIIAPPSGSRLIEPVMTSGRWLQPDDGNALIVGNHYLKLRPETQVGDAVQLRIRGKVATFRIVGIYEMAGSPAEPMVFTNYETFASLTGSEGQVSSLRIVTDRPDPARQAEVQQALDARFLELGIPANTQTGSDSISQQTRPVKILVICLVAMAMLIAIVGGLGLMGTMGMNVMERTREIGVMRSIGAVNLAIYQLVVVEGAVIGLISWAVGAMLSVPIASLLDRAVGVAMLNVPLRLAFSVQGLVLWLALVLILSALASLVPARTAVHLTVRDTLAYE